MLQQFRIAYRKLGVFKLSGLVRPQTHFLTEWEFPENAVLHYLPFNGTSLLPNKDDIWFTKIQKSYSYIYHQTDLINPEGNPIVRNRQTANEILEFNRSNRTFRQSKLLYSQIPKDTLAIINYGFLVNKFGYLANVQGTYFHWKNLFKTVINVSKEIATTTNKNQFLVVDIPEVTPSLPLLETYSVVNNNAMYKLFNSPERLFVLDMFKWLGDKTRSSSMLNLLNNNDLFEFNIIFRYKDHFTLLNLGFLNGLIKDFATEKEVDVTNMVTHGFSNTEQQKSSKDVKRYFLTFLNSGKLINDEITEEDEQVDEDDPEDQNLEEKVELELTSITNIEKRHIKKLEEDDEIKKPIASLFETEIENKDELLKDRTFVEKIEELLDQQLDNNRISAKDTKQLMKQIENSINLKDPYGSGKSLEESLVIKTEDIELDRNKMSYPEQNVVFDKNMLSSSIKSFDQTYIEKLDKKHKLNMIYSLQRAGLLIQEHEIEREDLITGSFETHRIKVKPVDGDVSTLVFKMPVVDADGTFKNNGVTYRLKKQKTDLPIRKIDSHVVSLTSYYGKLFVRRSDARVNDLGYWLHNKIIAKSIPPDPNTKPELIVETVDVTQKYFKCPRFYSMLGLYFSRIETDQYVFMFDPLKRLDITTNEMFDLKTSSSIYEINNQVLCGYEKRTKQPLVMTDKNNICKLLPNGEWLIVGNLFSIFNIPQQDAPYEYVEMKLLGERVPLVLIFGYLVGLTNIFKLYNIKPIVYESNKRVTLLPNQNKVNFKNCTLVFDNNTTEASLVLHGLLKIQKLIKNYDYELMDDKVVYFNIFSDLKMNARYLTELTTLNDIFIDPVTKQVLESIGEPTSFKGLLHRATELLTTDEYPDSSDGDYSRIRGYERFSGAIYNSLANSVRTFKTRKHGARKKLEMSPFEIWQKILQDPAVELVKEINPFEDMKGQEAVTFIGEGGRAKESMNMESRRFSKGDIGIISEATVDSADSGVSAFLSANPNFDNLLGTYKPIKEGDVNVPSIMSTTAISNLGALNDDKLF